MGQGLKGGLGAFELAFSDWLLVGLLHGLVLFVNVLSNLCVMYELTLLMDLFIIFYLGLTK